MMKLSLPLLSLLALAACAAPYNPPLVSAQFPPNAISSHSEPYSLSSLPPGAANLSRAPTATAPDYLSFTLVGG